MDFKKYSSIENSYKIKYVDKIKAYFPGKDFVVLEKIHGANFSFWTDGKEVRCAKRTDFLDTKLDIFFNFQEILEREKENIIEMFSCCEEHCNEAINELIVYGELFGGSYPHDDVPRNSTATKVQKHVYYSPNNEFMAFDAKVNGTYLDTKAFSTMCVLSGVPFIPVLFEGTLEECMNYKNDYPTTIPGILGLPAIEGNICEGNVIKPKKTTYFPNGERVILKNKNEKFKEVSGVHGQKKAKQHKEPYSIPEYLVPHMETIRSYVTENRLRNVISHIGIPEKDGSAFGKILKPFNQDIIEDFLKDNESFQELEKPDRKRVTSAANKAASDLLRKNFINILDGEF